MLGHVSPGRWPNVREQPDGRLLETIGPGSPLVVLSHQGDYLRCITLAHIGYIWAEYVDIEPVDAAELVALEASIAKLEGMVAT